MKLNTALPIKIGLVALFSICLTITSLYAQMKVGHPAGSPDGSAALDISGGPYPNGSSFRGLLPPKVALSQTSMAGPITKPAVGLLIYNTAQTGDVAPGYYYWEGKRWIRITTDQTGAARAASVNGQYIPAHLLSQVTSLSATTPDIIYIADEGKEGMFRYALGSTVTADGVMSLSVTSGPGRYLRIFEGSVNVKWFGAKGDGTTNDGSAIQSAIDYLKNSLSGKTHEGRILRFEFLGKYKVSTPLTTYRDITLDLNSSALDFSSLPTSSTSVAITISESAGSTSVAAPRTSIKNGIILGNPTPTTLGPNSGQWLNATGLTFKTHEVIAENVSIRGFNKAVDFETNAYIISFDNCQFRDNNIGVYFDATIGGRINLGENIRFVKCVISNNRQGVYNKLGGLFFISCSIDYNNQHISENITKISGYSSSNLTIDDCHIENSVDQAGMIINNGSMLLTNSSIWSNNVDSLIINNDELVLGPNHYRIPTASVYLVAGNRPQYTQGVGITGSNFPYIHPGLSSVPNGNFETSIGTSWPTAFTDSVNHIPTGTAANTTTKKYSGASSLLQTGTAYTSPVTYSPFIVAKSRQVELTTWVNNYDHLDSVGHFVSIVEFDFLGKKIKTTDIFIPKHYINEFFKVNTNLIPLDQGTQLIRIQLIGCNNSKKTYWDDFYLRW